MLGAKCRNSRRKCGALPQNSEKSFVGKGGFRSILILNTEMVWIIVLALIIFVSMFFRFSQLVALLDYLALAPFIAPKLSFFWEGFQDRSLQECKIPLDAARHPRRHELSDVRQSDWIDDGNVQTALLQFTSPAQAYLPDGDIGKALLVKPKLLTKPPRAWVVFLAATGDQGFSARKRLYAKPLADAGIASAILMIPFYGSRKSPGMMKHSTSSLQFVEDTGCQSVGCAWDAVGLQNYLSSQSKRPIIFAGASYGASMSIFASLSSMDTHGVVALCGSSGPRQPFLEGLLRRRVSAKIDLKLLDRALSLVDLQNTIQPKQDVARRVHFILARDDLIVTLEEGLALRNAFAGACPKAEIETEITWGGHASSLVMRPNLLVDAIKKMVADHAQ